MNRIAIGTAIELCANIEIQKPTDYTRGIMNTISLQVEGMKCGGCESLLKSALEAIPGVTAARPDRNLKLIEIDFEPTLASPQMFSDLIAGKGYQVAG